jgi:hypothetical protein
VVLPVLYYLATLLRVRQRPERLIPLLFLLIFFPLYLLHPMSGLSAPRYLISCFTMVTCAGFASMLSASRRYYRVAGLLMLILWCSVNALGVAGKIQRSSAQKTQSMENRQKTIDTARAMGLLHIKIIGGLPDQLRGIVLSFASKREVRFLALRDDRILEHHLGWEGDESAGYAFAPGLQRYFDGALQAMNALDYKIRSAPEFSLLGGMRPAHSQRRFAPVKSIVIQGMRGQGDSLGDWTRSTGVTPTGDTQRLVIELDGVRRIDGMRLFPVFEDLPRGPYDIEISRDGLVYEMIVTNRIRSGESYVSGNRIYIKDYESAQDHRWPPVEAAYVRMTIRSGRQLEWTMAEVLVFEHIGDRGSVEESEVREVDAWLQTNGMVFCWADRWMSRRLLGASTLPPPNMRYPYTMQTRRIPCRPDHAIVVDASMAAEAARLLRASLPAGVTLKTERFAAYTVLAMDGEFPPQAALSPPLIWNGHTLLRP